MEIRIRFNIKCKTDQTEYTELNKLIRMTIKGWQVGKKLHEVNKAIEKGVSIKNMIRKHKMGTNRIISLKNEYGETKNNIGEL